MPPNPPLPPGWTSAIDPRSGRLYYANATTGESSWEVPRPPPPPPPPQSNLQRAQVHHSQQMQHRFVPPQQQSRNNEDERQQRFIPPKSPAEVATGPSKAPAMDVSNIKTLASNGFLVAAARSLVGARTVMTPDNKQLELHALTAGQIVDLHSMQRERNSNHEDATFEPYLPINPRTLPDMAKGSSMEPSRLDIRVHSLYEKLKKIQQ